MSAQQTRGVIEKELGGAKIEDVFEWIDLDKPLGSASLAQVWTAMAHAMCCMLMLESIPV